MNFWYVLLTSGIISTIISVICCFLVIVWLRSECEIRTVKEQAELRKMIAEDSDDDFEE